MKIFTLLLFIALHAGASTAGDSATETVNSKWKEFVQPKLHSSHWEPRLTSPIPIAWPMHGQYVVYYAYAREKKSAELEVVGPVWAKMTSTVEGGVIFLLLTDEIKKTGIQKIHVTAEDKKVLDQDPMSLLLLARSAANDQKIREYYCLQSRLGNIPKDIESLHKPFFQWLGCK